MHDPLLRRNAGNMMRGGGQGFTGSTSRLLPGTNHGGQLPPLQDGLLHHQAPPLLQCKKNLQKMGGISPSDIDKYSRVLFPVSFTCFNLMYWIIYLNISEEVVPDLVLLGSSWIPPILTWCYLHIHISRTQPIMVIQVYECTPFTVSNDSCVNSRYLDSLHARKESEISLTKLSQILFPRSSPSQDGWFPRNIRFLCNIKLL